MCRRLNRAGRGRGGGCTVQEHWRRQRIACDRGYAASRHEECERPKAGGVEIWVKATGDGRRGETPRPEGQVSESVRQKNQA